MQNLSVTRPQSSPFQIPLFHNSAVHFLSKVTELPTNGLNKQSLKLFTSFRKFPQSNSQRYIQPLSATSLRKAPLYSLMLRIPHSQVDTLRFCLVEIISKLYSLNSVLYSQRVFTQTRVTVRYFVHSCLPLPRLFPFPWKRYLAVWSYPSLLFSMCFTQTRVTLRKFLFYSCSPRQGLVSWLFASHWV